MGDHQDREPHAPAAQDEHPLPGPDLTDLHHRSIGGGEPAAQACRSTHRDIRWQSDKVGIRPWDGNELGERAWPAEPWLPLIRADLRSTAGTLDAGPAAADEGDGDPIPDREITDSRAYRHD